MPRLYDDMSIANALRNEAIPALQALEDRPSLRDRELRRFEDDAPPPYESSTESEEYISPRPVQTGLDGLSEEDRVIFRAPLTEDERVHVMTSMDSLYSAARRYSMEEYKQRDCVHTWASRLKNKELRRHLAPWGSGRRIQLAERRRVVISRHFVKRRWQKLGVWNSAWGIPENCSTDEPESTKRPDRIGPWPGEATDTSKYKSNNPVERAIELRQGLHDGEYAPVPPRSHPTESSSDSQVESFLTSRPWFQIALEAAELRQRTYRFPRESGYRFSINTQQRWKDRGDWQDKWYNASTGKTTNGWKWRHESPSPEPEDLSKFETMADLELTPSETDALENIPVMSPDPYEPPSPGETKRLIEEARQWYAAERARAEAETEADADSEGEGSSTDNRPSPWAKAAQRQEAKPARQKKAKPQPAGEEEQLPQPQLRRSARIAAIAANKPTQPAKTAQPAKPAKPAKPTKAQQAQQTRTRKGPQPPKPKRAAPPAASRAKKATGKGAAKGRQGTTGTKNTTRAKGTAGVTKRKSAPKRRR